MVKALVLYHSQQHGNTEKMAEAVAEGLRSAGCEVTTHNTNDIRYPIEDYPQYSCVALGSPDYYSYIAGTMKTFMDDWYMHRNEPGYMNKPHAVFYSHGGGGRVRASLSLFNRLGNQVGRTLESRGTPNEKVLKECKKLGALLAESSH
jgi:NAD(P)H dehydrogenase (quinone)